MKKSPADEYQAHVREINCDNYRMQFNTDALRLAACYRENDVDGAVEILQHYKKLPGNAFEYLKREAHNIAFRFRSTRR